jgi:hypothetical protein
VRVLAWLRGVIDAFLEEREFRQTLARYRRTGAYTAGPDLTSRRTRRIMSEREREFSAWRVVHGDHEWRVVGGGWCVSGCPGGYCFGDSTVVECCGESFRFPGHPLGHPEPLMKRGVERLAQRMREAGGVA